MTTWRLGLFGQDAERIATMVYGDKSLTSKIAAENSLLGLYCKATNKEDQISVLRNSGGNSDRVSKYGFRLRDVHKLSTSFLRSCPECASFDLEERGYTAWRVLHQVPFFDHCPHHFCPLIEWRDFATSRPNSLVGLLSANSPIECEQDQSRLTEPSDGYARYLRLWRVLSDESIPELAIDAWSEIVLAATSQAGTLATLVSRVEESIEKSWGRSSASIGRLLGIEKNMSARFELSLNTRPRDLARRIIVFDALRSLDMIPTRNVSPYQSDFQLGPSISRIPEKATQLSAVENMTRLAVSLNIRPSLAMALLSNTSVKSALSQCHNPSWTEIYRLINAIPDELLNAINATFEANQPNWASQALKRRPIDGSE